MRTTRCSSLVVLALALDKPIKYVVLSHTTPTTAAAPRDYKPSAPP